MQSDTFMCELPNAAATDALGEQLACCLKTGVIYLSGQLGAGKSALVRAYLRARGVAGAIPSPTYTLIESYPLPDGDALHLDLYRLADPEELDYLGIRELSESVSTIWIEWADKVADALPAADIRIALSVHGDGRMAQFESCSAHGQQVIAWLANTKKA